MLYDFDGHASQMAHGAFAETLRLAASVTASLPSGRFAPANRTPHRSTTSNCAAPTFPRIRSFPSLRREPYSVGQCPPRACCRCKRRAGAAVGNDHTLQFFESFTDRLAVARPCAWNNAYIRLTCPEAYPVHRDIIEWNARFSADRIPDQAVGTDPLTTKLMHWVMQSWGRVVFFSRFLGGTIVPRLQLDFAPALACMPGTF